jgi:hypothetical protein
LVEQKIIRTRLGADFFMQFCRAAD